MKEVTLNGTTWVKALDQNLDRHYLAFQNDKANNIVEVGFGTDSAAPTGQGFNIKGSATKGNKDNFFEFGVCPVNAVYVKSVAGATHKVLVMYDD